MSASCACDILPGGKFNAWTWMHSDSDCLQWFNFSLFKSQRLTRTQSFTTNWIRFAHHKVCARCSWYKHIPLKIGCECVAECKKPKSSELVLERKIVMDFRYADKLLAFFGKMECRIIFAFEKKKQKLKFKFHHGNSTVDTQHTYLHSQLSHTIVQHDLTF